ncbi:hypothetical protein MGH68_17245 [Erysipelothrix sp. D19-032]
MSKEKNKEFILSRKSVIIGIQVIASVITVFFIYRMGLLPIKYFSTVVGIVVALLVLLGIFVYKTKGKINWFAKIPSLILSLFLVIGSGYAMKGGNLLSRVTGASKDTHIISIIVDKDSSYKTLSDLSGVKIAANFQMDKSNMEKGVELFEQKHKYKVSTDEYTSYENMNRDLLDGTIPKQL